MRMSVAYWLLLVAFLGAMVTPAWANKPMPAKAKTDQGVEDFRLRDLMQEEESSVTLSQYRGKRSLCWSQSSRIDKKGVLRYEGIFDNNQIPKRFELKAETATAHYVRDAVQAVLDGKPVKIKRVPTGAT